MIVVASRSVDRLALYGLAAFAAAGIAVWSASPASEYLDHSSRVRHPEGVVLLVVFALAWLLMSTAMMLPTATSLVDRFRRVVASRSNGGLLVASVVVGTLAIWATIGLALGGIDV